MADSFSTVDSDYEAVLIHKEIRDRTVECMVPRCWPLKYDADDGQMYLDRNMNMTTNDKPKGRHVQMRRYLFLRAFGFVPARRRLMMRDSCKKGCVNPLHVKVRAWSPAPEQIQKFIKKGWISGKDAHDWYLGSKE